MSYEEKDIVAESGRFFAVKRNDGVIDILVSGATHALSIGEGYDSEDLAIVRVEYLGRNGNADRIFERVEKSIRTGS